MTPSNPSAPSSIPEASSFEAGKSDAPRFTSGSGGGMTGEAKRAAGNAITQAKERAATMAQEQKQSAAERIGRYGSALRDSAHSLEGEDPNVAYFANRAAERIESLADYVRSTDLAGLRCDAEDIARRHPGLFLGGMFLAGLVVGGLVKTSAKALREGDSSSHERDLDDPYGVALSPSEMNRAQATGNL
jgi:hypothetical protein